MYASAIKPLRNSKAMFNLLNKDCIRLSSPVDRNSSMTRCSAALIYDEHCSP